jgi:hypothetical protein
MAVSNVELRVDARGAVQALKRTDDASKKLNRTLGTTEKRTATATGNIQRMGVSFRTTLGSIVALTGAVTFFSRSLNVLGERQADVAALRNGLEKLGKGAADLERLQEAADKLGKATLFDQEDFDRGFALLTSFTSIGVDSFERVAEAAADVAQVTKQDVNSSLLQLAKALQDPVRGLTALSRSGTTFTEQQKEQIKALVESGKLLAAQQFILAEIETQYNGAARAAGSAGYAGAVDSLGESFRDFQETIAKAVEPTVVKLLGGMTDLFDAISKIPEPAVRLALEIGGVTAAVVLLKKAVDAFIASKLAAVITTQISLMQAFGAQIYLTAAAQGALNAAVTVGKGLLAALPVAAVTLAVVGLADALMQAATDQANFNNLLNTGTVEQLEFALATEKSNLALERQRQLQGRGAGRAADQSRIERSQQKIKELEAALAEGMLGGGVLPQDQPEIIKPPKSDETTEQIKEQAEATGQLNLDAISYLETLEETEKIQFEAGRQIAEQLNLHDRLTKEAERRAKAEQLAAEAADPGNKMREDLEQLLKLENQVAAGATAIGNSFSNAFTSIINGTKSADQAIADMLSSVAEHFMNMAAQIIAKQLAMIAYGLIMKALGVGLGSAPDAGDANAGGSPLPQIANPGEKPFAEGGYVSGPTRAVVGEGGEPEYIIPQSKMRESMARYSRGARGGSVIPETGASGTSGESGGTAVATPIDVRYSVERINSVDYVTADQFQQGIQQAAAQGAKQGEQQTLKRLQLSGSTRKRIGL